MKKSRLFQHLAAAALALCLAAGLFPFANASDTGTAGTARTFDGSAYVSTSGELWIKSHNQYGQLGLGFITPGDDKTYETQWIKVMDGVASASYDHFSVAAIKTDGSLWMWGNNGSNQLGFAGGNATYGSGEYIYACQTTPVKVMDNVSAVALGDDHTAAIKTDGSLWLWGSNGYGAIGDGKGGSVYTKTYPDGRKESVHPTTDKPVKIMDNVAVVSCGESFTAAVKTDGSLWAWGKNTDGRLGNNFVHNGSSTSHLWQTTPVKVMDGVASVSCGGGASYAMIILKTDGTVWACGSHEYYKTGKEWSLADGYYLRAQPVPVQITDNAAAVYSVFDLAAVLKKDGSLWTWGTPYLGNGTRYASYEPVHIANDVVSVSLLDRMFVKNDGTVWIWANSYPLQYGSGILSRLKPVIHAVPDTMPVKLPEGYPVQITSKPIADRGTASAANLTITVNGKPVKFAAYSLKDENGGVTNYLQVRDVARALDGTSAQFQVDWKDGFVTLMDDWSYSGTNKTVPFSGPQPYRRSTQPTKIDGVSVYLEAIILTDSKGGDYTYYKLRDLGKYLDFNVSWNAKDGVTIQTSQPYAND